MQNVEVTSAELSKWEDLLAWENAKYVEIINSYVASSHPTEAVETMYYSFGEGDIYMIKFKSGLAACVPGKVMRLALASSRALSDLMDVPLVM